MKHIVRNLLKYWKFDLLILALLFVQAWCDLSLPQYTSDIIDTGIQNRGVEHILPEKMTKEEYELFSELLTEEEKKQFEGLYENSQELYKLTVKDEKELERLDETFAAAVMVNYQMCAVDEESFLEQAQGYLMQMNPGAEEMPQLTMADISAMFAVELTPDENGKYDIRPIIGGMLGSKMADSESFAQLREGINSMIDTMGSSMVRSMGIAYAIRADQAAGVNVKHLQKSYLWSEGFKMIMLALLMAAVSVVVSFFSAKVGAGIGRDLRKKVFGNVMKFSNAEMDRFSTASLITRSTNDIQQVQFVSMMLLRMVIYAPIMGIGGVIKVIQTKAGMGYIIGFALLVILSYVGILVAITMPKFKKMQGLVDDVNLVSREILTGLPVIRAFGREKTEEERFDKANKSLTKNMLFTNRVMSFMMPGMMMIMYGLTIVIVWVSAHRIDEGILQVGAMTAFITYAMMIVMSFLMLTAMAIFIPRAAVAADRIAEVLATQTSIKESENPVTDVKKEGVLCFDKVHFRYENAKEDALWDISFTAKPGQTTAIIGSTGCGKSTLVNLIPRLYDVTQGQITLDGVDIRELSLETLREQIGYVPQKAVLFSGTIASNLRFGNSQASMEEIEEAAKIAQAQEFISEKKEQYESEIAQGGSNVSGGQKQRLSIARAVAKKAKVYVFDDSFSALDLKTDAALRAALSEKVSDSTVIIVAQRISTIMNADQILVLDEGKVVGKGTHAQLMEQCEVYRQIASSQLSEEEIARYGKEAE